MIIERIKQIIEYKGISTRKFCIEIGVANGFLDKVKDVGVEKVSKILYSYPEINPEWLVTGKGDMLRGVEPPITTKESKTEGEGETVKLLIDKITEQAVEIAELKKRVNELESQNTKTLAFPKPNLAAESELGYKKGKD